MKRIIIAIVLTCLLCGCENVNQPSPIPSMPVQLSLNIMQDAPELNTMGGYKCYTTSTISGQYFGYGGIVIFHGFDDGFYAFDLACPNEVKRDVRVEVNMAGTAVCPECGSVYDVGFGSGARTKGPSKYGLKKYKVLVSGYNLRVVQ